MLRRVSVLAAVGLAGLLIISPAIAKKAADVETTRKATASSVPIPNAELWGAMARLGGTAWIDPSDGSVWEFAWDEPGEVMIWTSHRLDRDVVFRGAVNARGVVSFQMGQQSMPLTAQINGVFMVGGAEAGWRIYGRVTDNRLSGEMDELNNGQWVTNRTQEFQPLPASHLPSALAALAAKQAAYQAEAAAQKVAKRADAAAREAERTSPWGRISAMAGRRFIGNYGETPLVFYYWAEKADGLDAIHIFSGFSDKVRGDVEIVYNDVSAGTLRLEGSDGGKYDIFFTPDGSWGYYHARYRLLNDGDLEVTDGKWNKASRTFTPRKRPWIFRAVSDAENQQRIAQIEQKKNQSSGGLGSILAGAAMGAILGGGGQSSVDLAVAGAQAAAQGGNTLDVLNSMGSVAAANAAESKRQLDETIARAQGGTSGVAASSGSTAYGAASSSMAGSVSGAHSHALTKKTIHVWFDVGIQLLPNSDHNTMCYSITFPVTIDWIEGADDNLGRANAVLDPMIPAFKGKCERESGGRRTESGGEWLADAFSGWSQRPPLRKDDVEVQMP